MVVAEAVLEAVGAVAFVAEDAGDEGRVDEGFAADLGALLLVREDVGLLGRGGGLAVCFGSSSCPFAGFGALVGGLGSVVEAELAAVVC